MKDCRDARCLRAAPGESWAGRAEGCRYPMEATSNEQGLGFWGAKRTAFSAVSPRSKTRPDENR